jgi:Icc-related predicted phosphoesterase
MKLLFVADIHYALKQFDWLVAQAPKFDVTIIGGDLLDLSAALDLDLQSVVIGKYLLRLGEKTRLLVCSGNHDGDAHSAANESICRWLHEAKAAQVSVDGDSVELDGTLLTICPWWDGPVSRGELGEQLARDALRPKSRWIWIHHAPPDHSPVSWTGKKCVGDAYLHEAIQRYQPDLVLSGHVHNAPYYPDGSWIDRIGRTWVFNPGRQIGTAPAYLVIDLARMTATRFDMESERIRDLTEPTVSIPALPVAAVGS